MPTCSHEPVGSRWGSWARTREREDGRVEERLEERLEFTLTCAQRPAAGPQSLVGPREGHADPSSAVRQSCHIACCVGRRREGATHRPRGGVQTQDISRWLQRKPWSSGGRGKGDGEGEGEGVDSLTSSTESLRRPPRQEAQAPMTKPGARRCYVVQASFQIVRGRARSLLQYARD